MQSTTDKSSTAVKRHVAFLNEHNSVVFILLQLVWATTCSMGCGATYCSNLQGYPGGPALFLVCNYGPG